MLCARWIMNLVVGLGNANENCNYHCMICGLDNFSLQLTSQCKHSKMCICHFLTTNKIFYQWLKNFTLWIQFWLKCFLYFRELAEQVEQIAVLRVIDPAFPSVGKYNFTDARLDSRQKVVKGLWKILFLIHRKNPRFKIGIHICLCLVWQSPNKLMIEISTFLARIRDTTAIFLLRQTMVTLKPKLRHRVLHNALKNLPWTKRQKHSSKWPFLTGTSKPAIFLDGTKRGQKCSYVLSKHILTET